MRRRDFVLGLGGAIAACPLAAVAQPTAPARRVGVLMSIRDTDPEAQPRIVALRQALQQLGWTDGRNVRIELRWFAGDAERAKLYAKQLIDLAPEVIIAHTTPAITALRQHTHNIPIVFVQVADPVGRGVVPSLARPGGNITGFMIFEPAMGGKWVEVLKEIAPRVDRVAVLHNPRFTPYSVYMQSIDTAAPALGVRAVAAHVHDPAEIERAIASFAQESNGGLVVLPDDTTNVHRETIVTQAARHRLPAVYAYRYFATIGGLVSYGVDTTDLFRRAASYVDRILRGTKPSELPVQAPVKFELAINLKTAKALGLAIPESILFRADEVIE